MPGVSPQSPDIACRAFFRRGASRKERAAEATRCPSLVAEGRLLAISGFLEIQNRISPPRLRVRPTEATREPRGTTAGSARGSLDRSTRFRAADWQTITAEGEKHD